MRPKIASDDTARAWLGAPMPGRDVFTFGGALLIAAAFSAVQVFVLPRRLDVAAYGHYRLFLVYAGYVGLLYFGVVDGAFLRWAGRRPGAIGPEWRVVLRWLLVVQLGVVAAALLASLAIADLAWRLSFIALAACALFINSATLSSFALQSAGDFRNAGRAAVLPNGLFVVFVLVMPPRDLSIVLAAYVASWALAACFGAIAVWRATRAHARDGQSSSDPLVLRALMKSGLPVFGANLAAGLTQSADRLLVGLAVPISLFAQYAFASTVMVAGTTATHALSRVALSHAARRPTMERAAFLGGFFSLIAAGYGAGLVLEPLFERLVSASLPAYVPSLPILRMLLVGIPFWVATHVVLVGALQSCGFVRRQLLVELLGVTLVIIGCGACLVAHQPLWIVAAVASGAATLTFGAAATVVRRTVPGGGTLPSVLFALTAASQSGALLFALRSSDSWQIQSVVYALVAAAPTWLVARHAGRRDW